MRAREVQTLDIADRIHQRTTSRHDKECRARPAVRTAPRHPPQPGIFVAVNSQRSRSGVTIALIAVVVALTSIGAIELVLWSDVLKQLDQYDSVRGGYYSGYSAVPFALAALAAGVAAIPRGRTLRRSLIVYCVALGLALVGDIREYIRARDLVTQLRRRDTEEFNSVARALASPAPPPPTASVAQ
jgi:hypothetical protein